MEALLWKSFFIKERHTFIQIWFEILPAKLNTVFNNIYAIRDNCTIEYYNSVNIGEYNTFDIILSFPDILDNDIISGISKKVRDLLQENSARFQEKSFFYSSPHFLLNSKYPLIQDSFHVGDQDKPERKATVISNHWWQNLFYLIRDQGLLGDELQIYAIDAFNKGLRNGNRIKTFMHMMQETPNKDISFNDIKMLIILYFRSLNYANISDIIPIYTQNDVWNDESPAAQQGESIGYKVRVADSFFLDASKNISEDSSNNCFYLRSIFEGVFETLYGIKEATFENRRFCGFEYKKIILKIDGHEILYRYYSCQKVNKVNPDIITKGHQLDLVQKKRLAEKLTPLDTERIEKYHDHYCEFIIIEQRHKSFMEKTIII